MHEETIRQTDKKREEVSKQEEEANEKAQEQFLLLQELDIETGDLLSEMECLAVEILNA